MYDIPGGARAALAALVLLTALPAAADPFAALPGLCRSLQEEGWGLPPDLAKLDPNARIELSVPGIMYVCTLGRELPANDRGHAPDLGALLSTSTDDAGVILSAAWFCEADRAPALAALAAVVTKVGATLGVTLPGEMAAAIREGRKYESASDGIRYGVTPIDVDPGACSRVKPDDIGAVLGKLDVSIKRPK